MVWIALLVAKASSASAVSSPRSVSHCSYLTLVTVFHRYQRGFGAEGGPSKNAGEKWEDVDRGRREKGERAVRRTSWTGF